MTGAEYLQSLPDDVAAHVEFYINNGLVDGVLAVHTPDESGHCAGCTWHEQPRPVWPCPMAYCARVARELQTLFALEPAQGAGAPGAGRGAEVRSEDTRDGGHGGTTGLADAAVRLAGARHRGDDLDAGNRGDRGQG